MRPVVYTVTGVGVSPVCPLDQYISPFNIALSARVIGMGAVFYTVQYTFDDVFANNYNPATGNWVDHPTLTDQVDTQDANIAYPVTGIRLNVTLGVETVVLTIIQAGQAGT